MLRISCNAMNLVLKVLRVYSSFGTERRNLFYNAELRVYSWHFLFVHYLQYKINIDVCMVTMVIIRVVFKYKLGKWDRDA